MIDKVVIGECTLITADVLDGLKSLDADSIQCVVTSPPYWGLRDYGIDGMIGLEPTFQEWLDRMIEVMREVRRVLRPDGTVWLNIGDAYASGKGTCFNPGGGKESLEASKKEAGVYPLDRHNKSAISAMGFKPKDLLMMPARLAIALQADDWWIRSDIIWLKPNPMPEAVTDRPTSTYEHIFLLTKSARYYYDGDAVRETVIPDPRDSKWGSTEQTSRHNHAHDLRAGMSQVRTQKDGFVRMSNPSGRNLRNVWTISTQPYPEAHFATFPKALPMKCILAGTSERGCFPECGAPWERIVERGLINTGKSAKRGKRRDDLDHRIEWGTIHGITNNKTLRWQPGCSCGIADPVPCTVLDPFLGSGTTGLVAMKLDRRFVGIELNPEYMELARKRIEPEAAQKKLFI